MCPCFCPFALVSLPVQLHELTVKCSMFYFLFYRFFFFLFIFNDKKLLCAARLPLNLQRTCSFTCEAPPTWPTSSSSSLSFCSSFPCSFLPAIVSADRSLLAGASCWPGLYRSYSPLALASIHSSREVPSRMSLSLSVCVCVCVRAVSCSFGDLLSFTLTAFVELMDHGIVSWDTFSVAFIKKVGQDNFFRGRSFKIKATLATLY